MYVPGMFGVESDSAVGGNDQSEAFIEPPIVAFSMEHCPRIVVHLALVLLCEIQRNTTDTITTAMLLPRRYHRDTTAVTLPPP